MKDEKTNYVTSWPGAGQLPSKFPAVNPHLAKLKESPLTTQVGGDHYKEYKIQPIEYAMANGLDHCQANVVKYVTRFRDKDGLKDLEKAMHYIRLLAEFSGYDRPQ